MEPFSALGLAGNVVQFLEFGGKLLSGAIELQHATEGATSSNTVFENLTRDLVRICGDLAAKVDHHNSDVELLLPLMKSCQELGKTFLAVLEDLKVKGRRRPWKSVKQALRTVWKEKDILEYERQLSNYRSQIAINLLKILVVRQDQRDRQQTEILGSQTEIGQALDRLSESHHNLELGVVDEIARLRKKIVDPLTKFSETREIDAGNLVELPPDLHYWLSSLVSESVHLEAIVQIVEGLRFPMIWERQDNIKDAHPTTFEWLFKETSKVDEMLAEPSVLDWLENGSGVFWISGKAGSGKSTLMKFLCNEERTLAALKRWADGRKLLVGSFFFFNAGTAMQKSQQGLLQTLLSDILKQEPALIPVVCPTRWHIRSRIQGRWTQKELLQSFELLQKHATDTVRFCFFIDGLDEYDDDHIDITRLIQSLSANSAFKICCSSRPWNVFESTFGGNSGLKIRLQDLTRGDMTRFVQERLGDERRLHDIGFTDSEYQDLVNEIVERSDGVFLWVYLVVISLRRGIANLDTASELQKRLRALPSELEKYFKHILDSTEDVYHQQAARLYQIRLVTTGRLSALDLSQFAEEDLDFALDDEHVSSGQLNHKPIIAVTRTRVMARCQDLLEFDKENCLQFLHRSVKDFLETKDMQKLLDERAGDKFNAHHFVCNSMLLQMRLIARYLTLSDKFSMQFDAKLDTFWYHAHILETKSQLDYRLFPTVDECAWKQMGKSAQFWTNSRSFRETHYEGWLADRAADRGIEGLLPHAIGKGFVTIDKNGRKRQRHPLDVALRDMTSGYRTKIVHRLLDAGADPNAELRPRFSFWEAYLHHIGKPHVYLTEHYDEKHMIETLLLRGADPSVGVTEDFFRSRLSKATVPPADIERLENLRVSLQQNVSKRQPKGLDLITEPQGSRGN